MTWATSWACVEDIIVEGVGTTMQACGARSLGPRISHMNHVVSDGVLAALNCAVDSLLKVRILIGGQHAATSIFLAKDLIKIASL